MKYDPSHKYNSSLHRNTVRKFIRDPQKLVGTTWVISGGVEVVLVTGVSADSVTFTTPDLRLRRIFLEELLGLLSKFSLCQKPLPKLGGVYHRTTSQGALHIVYVRTRDLSRFNGIEAYPGTRTVGHTEIPVSSFLMEDWIETSGREITGCFTASIRRALHTMVSPTTDVGRQRRIWNEAFPGYLWEYEAVADTDKPDLQKMSEAELLEETESVSRAERLKEDPFAV